VVGVKFLEKMTPHTLLKRRLSVGTLLVSLAISAVALGRRVPVLSSDAPPYRRLGMASAPITIREYSDFQCPRCADGHPDLQALYARHPKDVQLVFHHMPLRQHKWAVWAARASEAAGRQGKFWEFAARLYETQKEWSTAEDAKPLLKAYAESLGLKGDLFMKDMESPAVEKIVTDERTRADALGIPATPTFLIKDRMLVGDTQLKAFGERFVLEELNK